MSLEDLLNSAVALPRPIPAKFANETPVMLQHVGSTANCLVTSAASAKTDHPTLWAEAEAALIALDEHPTDGKKGQAAWLKTYNLLGAANRLQ